MKVQIPLDIYQLVISTLVELPAKHVYGLLQRLDKEHVQVDDETPHTVMTPDV